MTQITPQPPRAPIGKTPDGTPVYIEPNWWKFFCLEMFNRMGGANAPSNDEISDSLVLSVFEQRLPRQNEIRNGDGLLIERDAAGPILSIDLHFVATFLRRESPQQFRPDDANAVIASKVFNR